MISSGARVSTGVAGIDEILSGGLIPRRAYMVRGGPGTGKTTLGFHFLDHESEHGLFVSLEEDSDQIRRSAAQQGFSLKRVTILDLSPKADALSEIEHYDILPAADAEEPEFVRTIAQAVDEYRPSRVFIDSFTQIRYLAPDSFQFRKQVIALLRYVTSRGATVLFTSEGGSQAPDEDLMFLSDGILELGWGDMEGRRQFRVQKYRSSGFSEGFHSLTLDSEGMKIYPRPVPRLHGPSADLETIGSGIQPIDALLHGGLERGTVNMLSGPTGTGKTTLGAQIMSAAAARGERSVIYMFEEPLKTLLRRSGNIGIPLESMIAEGRLGVETVEPLFYSPDQFADAVRYEVEHRHSRIVMLDSLSGYQLSIGGESMVRRLHALCRYLVSLGVTVVIVNEVQSITGDEFQATEAGISYLADTVIMLRYLEMDGELRKCIGVLKKRSGDFEKTLREFEITEQGIRVGEPLRHLRGILSGMPEPRSTGQRTYTDSNAQ